MRPRIAICHHAASDHESAVALALEEESRAGVELSLDPRNVERSVLTGPLLRAMSADALDVRYHFPLGRHELSDPSASGGREALAAMTLATTAIARHGGTHLTVHAALPDGAAGGPRFAETVVRLTELVQTAKSFGVTICLENLRWGVTSEPDRFLDLVEQSGALVTLDVGHAASSHVAARGFGADRFARAVAHRLAGAHVYGHEAERHHPPADIESIAPTLGELLDAGCAWWVIELLKHDELRRTRLMLLGFLGRETPSAVTMV